MRVIYKYPVTEEIEIPQGAIILKVGEQAGSVMLWAEINTEMPNEVRKFVVYGTGIPFDWAYVHRYLDTVFIGPLVWHVYEVIG